MISVRNHRQPLNGNSFFAALALVLLIAGCTPKVRVLRPGGSNAGPAPENTAGVPADQAESATADDVNNIALLLPFQLDKANQQAPSTVDIKRSALALDFYQGFRLGLDVLAQRGTNFKLNVLDTRDDAAENTRIAALEEVSEAALVVGPIYPKEIQVFGFNASLDTNTLQISPLAASMPAEFSLPNLVTLTAPLPAHVDALAQLIVDQYQPGDAVLFYETDDATSRQFLQPLKARVKELNSAIAIRRVIDQESLESSIHMSGTNLVVMGTTNRYLIDPILANLQLLRDEKSYDFKLFGHPNWAKINLGNEELMASFPTYVTASYYVDKTNNDVRTFEADYQREFGIAASEFAYKGYDAARYFGGLLAAYGKQYKQHMANDTFQGLHNIFAFEYNPEWGYVNRHIWILQYRDGDFRPVQ